MKTIRQALIDDVLYVLPEGIVDNKMMMRDLDGDAEISKDVMLSKSYQGCLADLLMVVVEQAINYSEADKSINVPTQAQLDILKSRINKIYVAIGEAEENFASPKVTFM